MQPLIFRILRLGKGFGLVAMVIGTGCGAAYWANQASGHPTLPTTPATTDPEASAPPKIQRVGRDGLSVPPEIARNIRLATAVASGQVRPIQLPALQGCLAVDNNQLYRVHSRLAGEVVAVGPTADGASTIEPESASQALQPPLRTGDRVRKGDLLAVVWSKDLGEKKSELIEAVSKLKADEVAMRRLQDAYAKGSVPEKSVLDAERAVAGDRITVDRLERTLRSWRVTDAEIAEVRAEAALLSGSDTKRSDQSRWARVDVRAPHDGVILEKNVTVGDIVDTTADLFKIADVSHLAVWVHVYEEDLPLIQGLPRPIGWTVTVPSRPSVKFAGSLEQISEVIDPNQHTALVTGRVENPARDLKVGQFVTVSVVLPAPIDQLELPVGAVIEDGRESLVFVQPVDGKSQFVRTPVQVVRRFRDGVCIRTGTGLKAGDRVVTSGSLLLRDAMDELPRPE